MEQLVAVEQPGVSIIRRGRDRPPVDFHPLGRRREVRLDEQAVEVVEVIGVACVDVREMIPVQGEAPPPPHVEAAPMGECEGRVQRERLEIRILGRR